MMLSKAIIVELDGCLADHRHRLHCIKNPYIKEEIAWPVVSVSPENLINFRNWEPDWDAYYAGIPDDGLNEWCDRLIFSFNRLPHPYDTRIIFVTGRPEKYRETTIEWIDAAIKCHSYELKMRPDFLEEAVSVCSGIRPNPRTDNRPGSEVKHEIYEREIRDKYDVLFVIENDEECARMYRELGLTVLMVMQ